MPGILYIIIIIVSSWFFLLTGGLLFFAGLRIGYKTSKEQKKEVKKKEKVSARNNVIEVIDIDEAAEDSE